MNILAKPLAVLITDVSFYPEMLQVSLSDGREIRVPLERFPTLRDASPRRAPALASHRQGDRHSLAGSG